MNLTTIARYVVGLIFVVFGANKFLHFMPMPEMAGAAGEYMGGLAAAGYFFPVLALVEIVGGLALLTGKYVPLGITLLAAPIVQILLFHTFLAVDPMGTGMAVVLTVGAILIARGYKDRFAGVLSP